MSSTRSKAEMGERFGKYELGRRIGTGGMAEVFQAKTFGAEGFEKDIVIKRILPAFSEDPDFVNMFINEARLAVKLQHANIVQIFDFNQVAGIYYIAMEWVNGVDLKKVINTSRRRAITIPLRLVLHVGVETLKGLHYAHSKREAGAPLQLVHRDISPHNLLISYAGEVKIADFGIAKAAAIASVTRSGSVKGKLAYMSPEQALIRPLDARSDLFSLGVVLWELLCRRRLYPATHEMELLALVKEAKIPSPRAFNEELPEELETTVMRLLARDPGQRYSSAEEALNHLHRLGDVGDALKAAEYLRKLLPENAALEGKGETLILPPQCAQEYRMAGPDALTRTTWDIEESDVFPPRLSWTDSLSPSKEEKGPTRPDLPHPMDRLDAGTLPEVGPSSRRFWPLVAGIFCFVIFGFCGFWFTGRTSLEPGPALAAMTILSQPNGAKLFIDGIEMGATPLKFEAPRGQEVLIEARFGPRRKWVKKIRSSPNQKLLITLPPESSFQNSPKAVDVALPVARAPAPVQKSSLTQGQRGRTITANITRSDRFASSSSKRPDPNVTAPSVVPRRVRDQGWGFLDVVVSPWANVKMDGKELGQTPLRKRRIRAGKHQVSIFNSELKKLENIKISISAGQKTTIRRDWGEGP